MIVYKLVLLFSLLHYLSAHSLTRYWEDLDKLYKQNEYFAMRHFLSELEGRLNFEHAVRLVENAILTWKRPKYIGLVAAAMSNSISVNPSKFLNVATTIYTAHPHASAFDIIQPFVKGKEHIVYSAKWIQDYLKNGEKSTSEFCPAQESRDCGIFQANIGWVIRSFPQFLSAANEWISDWAMEVMKRQRSSKNFVLKYSYIHCCPIGVLLQNPSDVLAWADDLETMSQLAEEYAKIPIKERMEAIEFYLWLVRNNDALSFLPKKLSKSYKWMANVFLIPSKKDCDSTIKQLIMSDSYRSLSLIWQTESCSRKIENSETIDLILKNAQFSFAVYLAHGSNVNRQYLKKLKLSKLYRLMLDIVPLNNQGTTLWNPCTQSQSQKPAKYLWDPPVSIMSLPSESAMFLIRFFLYIQFGVPFDHTRTETSDTSEGFDWLEIPGMATALLDRHCQLIGKKPAYIIKSNELLSSTNFGTSETGEMESRGLRENSEKSRPDLSDYSDIVYGYSDTAIKPKEIWIKSTLKNGIFPKSNVFLRRRKRFNRLFDDSSADESASLSSSFAVDGDSSNKMKKVRISRRQHWSSDSLFSPSELSDAPDEDAYSISTSDHSEDSSKSSIEVLIDETKTNTTSIEMMKDRAENPTDDQADKEKGGQRLEEQVVIIEALESTTGEESY